MKKCYNSKCNVDILENRKYCSYQCRNVVINSNRDYTTITTLNNKKRDQAKKRYFENPTYCKYCNAVLSFERRTRKYCNNSCAASYSNSTRIRKSWTEKQKKHASDNTKKQHIVQNIKRVEQYINNPKYCRICHSIIEYINRHRKTCSVECYKKCHQQSAHKRSFGGETNYYKYMYNGIYMDSSWEVEIAQYLDECNISWQRSKKYFFTWIDDDNKVHRYYPDFYLNKYDIYLDPKNSYKMKLDKVKLDYVTKNYNIILYVGDVNYIKNCIYTMINYS